MKKFIGFLICAIIMIFSIVYMSIQIGFLLAIATIIGMLVVGIGFTFLLYWLFGIFDKK